MLAAGGGQDDRWGRKGRVSTGAEKEGSRESMDFKLFQPTLDLLELRRLVKSGASLPKTVGRGRFAGEEESRYQSGSCPAESLGAETNMKRERLERLSWRWREGLMTPPKGEIRS